MGSKRNERKEREKEMIAQMEEALKEQKQAESEGAEDTPKSEGGQLHCHKCKTLMENGKCPTCGYSVYVPMDARKQKKIRWIATGIMLVVFLIIFFATR